ncbi:hypothetical protein BaRGS_00030359 [Batillaria attramentaria]|uniref:Uncharacterized protein n=1 Tax=Batillaria attramentaria TaxID=370345 RepID=A0ABD0JUS7_9CAEN
MGNVYRNHSQSMDAHDVGAYKLSGDRKSPLSATKIYRTIIQCAFENNPSSARRSPRTRSVPTSASRDGSPRKVILSSLSLSLFASQVILVQGLTDGGPRFLPLSAPRSLLSAPASPTKMNCMMKGARSSTGDKSAPTTSYGQTTLLRGLVSGDAPMAGRGPPLSLRDLMLRLI